MSGGERSEQYEETYEHTSRDTFGEDESETPVFTFHRLSAPVLWLLDWMGVSDLPPDANAGYGGISLCTGQYRVASAALGHAGVCLPALH